LGTVAPTAAPNPITIRRTTMKTDEKDRRIWKFYFDRLWMGPKELICKPTP
jgi:hypothetical protein